MFQVVAECYPLALHEMVGEVLDQKEVAAFLAPVVLAKEESYLGEVEDLVDWMEVLMEDAYPEEGEEEIDQEAKVATEALVEQEEPE